MTAAQNRALPTVGFLNSSAPALYSFNAAAFRDGLRDGGFVEGQTVAIEYRWANNDYTRLPELAAELVGRHVLAIAATGDIASARAAQAATRTIPIVFTVGSDPISFGLVRSLARPDGNATGITLFSSTLSAKRMEFLCELVPTATRIGLLMNPDNQNVDVDTRALQDAAVQRGRKTVVAFAKGPGNLEAAFATLKTAGAGGLVLASDPMFLSQRDRVTALAAATGIPMMYWTREFVLAGGLMSYGITTAWMYHEAGVYVARLLKGAKPADLPVVQPSRFDLVINRKTVKALGLTLPPSLVARADQLVE